MDWVLTSSKSKGAARLVLLSIANHVGPLGEGWVYVKTVTREANVSEGTYLRAVRELEASGEIVRVLNDGGTRKTRADARPNTFRIVGMRTPRGAQDAGCAGCPPRQDDHPGGAQDDHPAGYSGCAPIAVPDRAVPEPSKRATDRAGFDEWWELYPKKVKKLAAEKAWPTAVKKAGGDPQTLIGALRAQLPQLEHTERQFRPDPTSWLNQGRWADEVARAQSFASQGALERLAERGVRR